ncbi:MAG: gamma-glutamyltransferase, partial [Alphaproteobacteria bacterium]|nr:gamma-glutamyltransferase [Alphaproteobacteria bacterium]
MTVQLIRGSHALVSSGHHVASFEAAAVLRDGGNVVDAAIAGAAVLAVVLPYACGLGGDLFLLHHDAATGTLHGLNATGAAPRAATPDRFAAAMPDEGALSITVPAMVAGWAAAADRFASRPLGALLAPAVRLAEHGFPVHAALSRNAATKAALLRRDEAACALFLPGDRPPAEGAHFRQPDAAATLARIAAEGPDGFYRGPVAARIAAAVAAAGGLLTADDLATASAQWQTPIRAPFAGFDVATMPPNSWGLTLLLQLLALEAGGIAATRGDDAAFFRSAIAARRAAYRAALP